MFAANTIVENVSLVYNKTVLAYNLVKLLTEAATRGIIMRYALESVPVLDQINNVTEASVVGAVFISENPELIEIGCSYSPSIVISPSDAPTVIKYCKKC